MTVDGGAIQSLFLPTGEVGQHADRLRYWCAAYSKAAAPKRTGALSRSIKSDRRGSGRTQSRFTVWTTSPYGYFVHEGTGSPIRPRNGSAMVLYQIPRIAPARWAHTQGHLKAAVSGQGANNFMQRGMRRAMRKYGYGVVF